jgi:pimeloyl-ACP methyl ester carboxylesterase
VADVRASGTEPAWGAERKTVTLANGMRMGYVELGDPGKPTIVFLHGITNSSLGYLPLGRLLAQDHHVFLLDQRGHGVSDKPPCCYTRLDFAHDAKLFMDLFGLQRAHIAGHSLGGMVAQTLAAFWPERVDRLMIIGSTIGRRSLPSRDSPRPPPIFGALDADIRALKDPIDPDSAFMKVWWDVPGLDPQIQYHMRRESARIPADIWRAMLDQGEVARDLRVTAHRITAPTLLLFGGKDSLFSAADNADMAAWLPHAQAVTLAELGHSLPEEDPQAVSEALLDFLRQP